MSDRQWRAKLKAWYAVGDVLDKENRCMDLLEAIDHAGESAKGNEHEPATIAVDIDDCALVREVIADLGIEAEFEDVTAATGEES